MELPHLPDWFRELSVDPATIDMQARARAIEAIAKSTKLSDVPGLVRFTHGMAAVDARDRLIESVRVEDPVFPLRDNDYELRVVAAAAAIATFEQFDPDEIADVLALGTLLAGKLKWNVVIADLSSAAERYLRTRADRLHRLPNLPSAPKPNDFSKAIKDWTEQAASEDGDLADVGAVIFRSIANQLDGHSKFVREGMAALNRRLVIALQELDLLWWIESGRSTFGGGPWAAVSKGAVPLVIGAEFASRVTELPGPDNFEALLKAALKRSGVKSSQTTYEEAVTGLTPGESEHILRSAKGLSRVADLCPVHACVQAATETDDNTWVAIARKRTSQRLDGPLEQLDLASRTYLEALFVRVLTASDG